MTHLRRHVLMMVVPCWIKFFVLLNLPMNKVPGSRLAVVSLQVNTAVSHRSGVVRVVLCSVPELQVAASCCRRLVQSMWSSVFSLFTGSTGLTQPRVWIPGETSDVRLTMVEDETYCASLSGLPQWLDCKRLYLQLFSGPRY